VAFALGAVVSVFAGTSVSSLLGYVDTSTTSGYLLPAATVTFLGSIFLKNGVVNIWGTVMATVFLAVFLNGSTLVGIPTALRDSGEGLILLLAIGVSRSLQTRAEKRAL
jgi:ribose transport system permease protein